MSECNLTFERVCQITQSLEIKAERGKVLGNLSINGNSLQNKSQVN